MAGLFAQLQYLFTLLGCRARTNTILGPTVRFMSENIQKLGGELNRDNVQCRRCDDKMAGAFDPRYGILLCANHIYSRGHAEETIAHGTYAQTRQLLQNLSAHILTSL